MQTLESPDRPVGAFFLPLAQPKAIGVVFFPGRENLNEGPPMKPDLTTVLVALAVAVSLGLARDLTSTEGFGTGATSDRAKTIRASVADDPIAAYQGGAVWNGSQREVLPPSKDTSPDQ
jgi:hypothetical protein